MWIRWIAGAMLGLAVLLGAPRAAFAQQMYECTWIVTITEIRTTYADGSTKTEWHYSRTEVCHPI